MSSEYPFRIKHQKGQSQLSASKVVCRRYSLEFHTTTLNPKAVNKRRRERIRRKKSEAELKTGKQKNPNLKIKDKPGLKSWRSLKLHHRRETPSSTINSHLHFDSATLSAVNNNTHYLTPFFFLPFATTHRARTTLIAVPFPHCFRDSHQQQRN